MYERHSTSKPTQGVFMTWNKVLLHNTYIVMARTVQVDFMCVDEGDTEYFWPHDTMLLSA